MNAIRVLLADDHTILRQGLRSLLESEDDILIVGEACDGRQAIELAKSTNPDVIVMDISMQGMNGLEATRQILKKVPNTKVVILSIHEKGNYVGSALRAGASGYIVKSSAYDELKQAIQAAARGDTYLSPSISHVVVDGYLESTALKEAEAAYESLTSRQREILQLIAEGRTRSGIASLLHLSPKTVSRHREDLMHNLGIANNADLVKFAVRLGIVNTNS